MKYSLTIDPAATPTTPTAWRDRGAKLMAAGDRKGAAAAFQRYLTAPIADPPLRLAAKDMAEGRFKPAGDRLRAHLNAHPHDPLALWLFGQIGLRLNSNFGLVEASLRHAIGLAPDFAPLRFDLVKALFLQGKAEETLAELAPLLAADPQSGPYRELQAGALSKIGDFAAAVTVYEALIADEPANAGALVRLGILQKTLRQSDAALAAFRRATAIDPLFGEAWWHIANMKTGALTAEDKAAIERSLASPGLKPADRFHLRFALARALEEAGDHEAAFAGYRAANRDRLAALPNNGAAPGRVEAAARMAALFTPDYISARESGGDPSAAPIFILGMPRSGSTLLEQILSCHPAIEGTQELADLPIVAQQLKLAQATPDDFRAAGTDYIARVAASRKTDRPHFLDKQPANWLHAGLIHLMLPNATIIDMRRDPLECCLSMYRQHFARGALFTYSIPRLAEEYRAYEALMAHFDDVLPGRIFSVQLADLVDDLEGTVRALLEKIGLPFSPQCLDFHASDRAVFTPSSEQVRRPINRESADLLRNFAPHIGELREALSRGA